MKARSLSLKRKATDEKSAEVMAIELMLKSSY